MKKFFSPKRDEPKRRASDVVPKSPTALSADDAALKRRDLSTERVAPAYDAPTPVASPPLPHEGPRISVVVVMDAVGKKRLHVAAFTRATLEAKVRERFGLADSARFTRVEYADAVGERFLLSLDADYAECAAEAAEEGWDDIRVFVSCDTSSSSSTSSSITSGEKKSRTPLLVRKRDGKSGGDTPTTSRHSLTLPAVAPGSPSGPGSPPTDVRRRSSSSSMAPPSLGLVDGDAAVVRLSPGRPVALSGGVPVAVRLRSNSQSSSPTGSAPRPSTHLFEGAPPPRAVDVLESPTRLASPKGALDSPKQRVGGPAKLSASSSPRLPQQPPAPAARRESPRTPVDRRSSRSRSVANSNEEDEVERRSRDELLALLRKQMDGSMPAAVGEAVSPTSAAAAAASEAARPTTSSTTHSSRSSGGGTRRLKKKSSHKIRRPAEKSSGRSLEDIAKLLLSDSGGGGANASSGALASSPPMLSPTSSAHALLGRPASSGDLHGLEMGGSDAAALLSKQVDALVTPVARARPQLLQKRLSLNAIVTVPITLGNAPPQATRPARGGRPLNRERTMDVLPATARPSASARLVPRSPSGRSMSAVGNKDSATDVSNSNNVSNNNSSGVAAAASSMSESGGSAMPSRDESIAEMRALASKLNNAYPRGSLRELFAKRRLQVRRDVARAQQDKYSMLMRSTTSSRFLSLSMDDSSESDSASSSSTHHEMLSGSAGGVPMSPKEIILAAALSNGGAAPTEFIVSGTLSRITQQLAMWLGDTANEAQRVSALAQTRALFHFLPRLCEAPSGFLDELRMLHARHMGAGGSGESAHVAAGIPPMLGCLSATVERMEKIKRELWTPAIEEFANTLLRPDRPQYRAAYLAAKHASSGDTDAATGSGSGAGGSGGGGSGGSGGSGSGGKGSRTLKLSRVRSGQLVEFADVDVRLLADAFVVVDYELLARVPLEDLLRRNWELERRGNEGHYSKVFNSVRRWVQVGDWVATEIVCHAVLRVRSGVLRKMIDLASELWIRGDFHSATSVVSSLQSAAIARLRQTWRYLPNNAQRKFEALSELCGPIRHFHFYREEVNKRLAQRATGATVCVVPFLGLVTQELTSLHESVPDCSTKHPSHINFDKVMMSYKILGRYYDALFGSAHALPSVAPEILSFAARLTEPMSEEALYAMSEKLEMYTP